MSKKPYKLIVAGSRDFKDYNYMFDQLDAIVNHLKPRPVTIVSGGASGADTIAEGYADDNDLEFVEFLANWNDMSEPCVVKVRRDGSKYNALAGPNRNQKMADYGDGLVAFFGPNGETRGTQDMIRRAKANNLPVKVYHQPKKV